MSTDIESKSFLSKYYPYLIIVLLILLIYTQNLWFDFSYIDDNLIVFDEFDKINSLSKIPSTFVNGYLYDNYYRPMVMTSFILDTAIAGQSSPMYHLTNIILHLIVTLLLFKILVKVGIKQIISLITTSFYAIHPLNVSAVSWIVGRNDLLLALFSVASLFYYIKYQEGHNKKYLIFSLSGYFFAMLSKEVGVLVPLIILLYELLIRKESVIKIIKFHTVFYYAVPAAIYLLLRYFVASINVREEIGITSFLLNIYIFFEYLAKTLYFIYIDPLPIKNNLLIAIGIVFLILLIIYFVVNIKKNKHINVFAFGFLFLVIFILPTLFVRVNASDGEFNYIDCRMYLPLFGLMFSFAVIIESFSHHIKKSFNVIMITILFAYTVVFAHLNNLVYRNGFTYWNAALEKNPNRATYWMGIGFYYFDNKMYKEAIHCAINAINLKPHIPSYYYKAAFAYETAGEFLKANEFLEKVSMIEDDKSFAMLKMAKNYLRLMNKQKADSLRSQIENLEVADTNKRWVHFSTLSYYYNEAGYIEDSIILMKKAIDLQNNNPKLLNDLGVFFYKKGDKDSAKVYFSKALSLDPANPDYLRNFNIVNK